MLAVILFAAVRALACDAHDATLLAATNATPDANAIGISRSRSAVHSTADVATSREDCIRVFDLVAGCEAPSPGTTDVWKREGDAYVLGSRRVSVDAVARLRELALATTSDAPDLLAQVGFTPVTLTAHRADIYAVLYQENWEAFGIPRKMPASVERLLTYEHLAPKVRRELLRGGDHSTTDIRVLQITLPGEPSIILANHGVTPWKQPWRVRVGADERRCASLAISRAVIDLAPPDSLNRTLLDGESYWRDDVWRDEDFWNILDTEVEEALVRDSYSGIGFAEADVRFRVNRTSMIGGFGSKKPKLDLGLVAKDGGVIDYARWLVPVKQRTPSATWNDFLACFDAAEKCAERESWLAAWKRSGLERTIVIEVLDHSAYDEGRDDWIVKPAWSDAGFQGAPDAELLLMRSDTVAGKIYVSRTAPGALIIEAVHAEGSHWFDALDVSYRPSHPEYARVDSHGRVEKRTRGQ
jgi:hypothetical protein